MNWYSFGQLHLFRNNSSYGQCFNYLNYKYIIFYITVQQKLASEGITVKDDILAVSGGLDCSLKIWRVGELT